MGGCSRFAVAGCLLNRFVVLAWEVVVVVGGTKELKVPGEAILVGKFGPMPRTAKLHRLSIAIAEPLHSGIASTSLVHDRGKGMHTRLSIGARLSF
jgi:hypothetical protein